MMKLKKILSLIITILLSFIIYLIIKENYFFIWMKNEIIILTSIISSVVFIRSIHSIKNKKIDILLIVTYSLLLIIILFHRPITNNKIIKIDFDYLSKWLKILFKNKIVFLNIFGNIILFIPMGIIINYKKTSLRLKILFLLIIIILIEISQLIFNLGIFDIMDIILNLIGGIIGITLTYQKKELI